MISLILAFPGCGTSPTEPGASPTPTPIPATPTPTPVPIPSKTPTPVPTPTPADKNSMNYVSSDPPPGSILPLGTEVSVTVDYHAREDGVLFVLPVGGSVFTSGGNGSKVTAGTGRITAKFTAGGPGTSTGIFMSLHNSKNAEVLTVTVQDIPYTWDGAYTYKLDLLGVNPPSGSTLKVGDPVTFRVSFRAYQAVRFQASFNPLGISCPGSVAWIAATEDLVATFQCTSPQAGTSTSATLKMTTADGVSVLATTEDPALIIVWN